MRRGATDTGARISFDDAQIAEFCRKWRVTEFALFGSVLRGDFRPDSDVDVPVTFDPDAGWSLFDLVDMVTLENEFVDAASLRALEEADYRLYPTARSLALVQDKLVQKHTLAAAGLPVSRFAAVGGVAEVEQAGSAFGWPVLLKARRNAYDGRGNATLLSAADAALAWEKLGGGAGRVLFVEAFCHFTRELAVIVTRGRDGASVSYPVVETIQRDHVCHVVKAPAAVPTPVAERAAEMARRAVAAVGAVGSFGVEMSLTRAGDIVVNELAPRVHNSGHYTIEACVCSQFENHLRAVLGWPLGATTMVSPAAAMVNLLGEAKAAGRPHGLERALAVPGRTSTSTGRP